MHWGRMISKRICRRVNASECAASHCPDGIDAMAPRTISETLAMTGSAVAGNLPALAVLSLPLLFAAGMSWLHPALLVLALSRAPDSERASVVGTFSSFFDLSQGVGALVLGAVAELSGYRGAFFAAGLFAIAALFVLRGRVRHPVAAQST